MREFHFRCERLCMVHICSSYKYLRQTFKYVVCLLDNERCEPSFFLVTNLVHLQSYMFAWLELMHFDQYHKLVRRKIATAKGFFGFAFVDLEHDTYKMCHIFGQILGYFDIFF